MIFTFFYFKYVLDFVMAPKRQKEAERKKLSRQKRDEVESDEAKAERKAKEAAQKRDQRRRSKEAKIQAAETTQEGTRRSARQQQRLEFQNAGQQTDQSDDVEFANVNSNEDPMEPTASKSSLRQKVPPAKRQATDAERQAACRSRQSVEKRNEVREINNNNQKKARIDQSDDSAATRRNRHRQEQERLRAKRNDVAQDDERRRNTAQHATARNARSQEQLRDHLDNRNNSRRQRLPAGYRMAARRIVSEDEVTAFNIGAMDQICPFCSAVHFLGERPADKKFTLCCHKGRVRLPLPAPFPELIRALFTETEHPQYAHFMTNILRYYLIIVTVELKHTFKHFLHCEI